MLDLLCWLAVFVFWITKALFFHIFRETRLVFSHFASLRGEGRVTKGIKVKKRWSGQPMIGLYLDLTALQRKL